MKYIFLSHNLQIHGLINSDAGMFQCIGSNPAGSIQAAARLQIGKLGKKFFNIKCAHFVFFYKNPSITIITIFLFLKQIFVCLFYF